MTDEKAASEPTRAPLPDDDRLRDLFRFGWASAELRGRHRQLLTGSPALPLERANRAESTLPLNQERSSKKLLRQSEQEVMGLAVALNLDLADLPHRPQDETGGAVAVLQILCDAAHDATTESRATAWLALHRFFYSWDTRIQDVLISGASQEAAAYQLGRGLAECYWSLEPSAEDHDVRSWSSLLGEERREALKRFLVHLTPPLDAVATAAVRASLDAWSRTAGDVSARSNASTVHCLHDQLRLWRMLLVDHVSPRSFVDSRALLEHVGRTGVIMRAFLPETFIGTAGVLLAFAAVAVLTLAGTTHVVGVILAILGFFGITSAGVLARAKDAANASLARMRDAADSAIIAEAITVDVPTQKKVSHRGLPDQTAITGAHDAEPPAPVS